MLPQVIYTIFSGRRENLGIQFRYLDKLIDQNDIDEVHLWDYSREVLDSIWLKRLLSHDNEYEYTAAKYDFRQLPLKELSSFNIRLGIKGKSDSHLLIKQNQDIYEIVLGGWNNTRSVIRKNGREYLAESYGHAIKASASTEYTFNLDKNIFTVYCNRRRILRCKFASSEIPKMFVAGYNRISITYDLSHIKDSLQEIPNDEFVYIPRNISKFKYFATPRKYTWVDYYEHYTPEAYPKHIIVKADDDVVYLDTKHFKTYIEECNKSDNALMTFPSIVNNGVCAHYQQEFGLLPKDSLGVFPYDTYRGRLWDDGVLCEKLHDYFINSKDKFLKDSAALPNSIHKQGDRISINMFAVKTKDLSIYKMLCEIPWSDDSIDDELHITTTIPSALKRHSLVVSRFVIAHLSFYRQIQTGLDIKGVQQKYLKMATSSA
jgi:hypothetical protein